LKEPTVYEVLADAFRAEGADAVFGLMGDANMHWSLAMKDRGARLFHARHEHSAVGMADGYARATGNVGVATVTCGPGFTQIMTALTVSSRAGTPMVVFAGDTPTTAGYHVQELDQAPLTVATGATFLPIRRVERALDDVKKAFYLAKGEKRTVVLSVPIDLQKQKFTWAQDYVASGELIPLAQRINPDATIVEQVSELITKARRPIIVGGRGAVWSEARAEIERLADQCGALLATSLPAKDLFHGHPFFIGIAGAFSSNLTRELFSEADLVIGIGVGLGHYTTEGGYLYPNAKVVQIDSTPRGLWQGLRTADIHMIADARAGASALTSALKARGASSHGSRSNSLRQRIADDVPDDKEHSAEPGSLDPRKAIVKVNELIPRDWDIVCGSGHCFNFVATHLSGRDPRRYYMVTDFGTIGQAPVTAIGVAAARGNGKVVLFQGDGSLLMHIQELEMIARHGIKLLICTLNDGAYSSEVHMLKAKGFDPSESIFGRTDLAAVARAFGMQGHPVKSLDDFPSLFEAYCAGTQPVLWDVPISGIPSAQYRRLHYGEI
jgi:thiamine pyrophosphate-dependent acetolactate synthase large subunit-like protein